MNRLLRWCVPARALSWDLWDQLDGFFPKLPAGWAWYSIPEDRPATEREQWAGAFRVMTGRFRPYLGRFPPGVLL